MEHSCALKKMSSAAEMYLQRGDRRWLKRFRNILRYYAVRQLYRTDIRKFLKFLQQHPMWKTLFLRNLHHFHALLFKFAKRLSSQQRRYVAELTLTQMQKLLCTTSFQQLLQHQQILLSRQLASLRSIYRYMKSIRSRVFSR